MRGFKIEAPSYGDALKAALSSEMRKRGMSRVELCKRIGVSTTMLSKTLNGARDINVGYLVAIADALEVSCDYLLGRSEDSPDIPITSKESALVEYLDAVIDEMEKALKKDDRMEMKRAIKYAILLLNDIIWQANDRIQAKD